VVGLGKQKDFIVTKVYEPDKEHQLKALKVAFEMCRENLAKKQKEAG
jgi:hypothetical protein